MRPALPPTSSVNRSSTAKSSVCRARRRRLERRAAALRSTVRVPHIDHESNTTSSWPTRSRMNCTRETRVSFFAAPSSASEWPTRRCSRPSPAEDEASLPPAAAGRCAGPRAHDEAQLLVGGRRRRRAPPPPRRRRCRRACACAIIAETISFIICSTACQPSRVPAPSARGRSRAARLLRAQRAAVAAALFIDATIVRTCCASVGWSFAGAEDDGAADHGALVLLLVVLLEA